MGPREQNIANIHVDLIILVQLLGSPIHIDKSTPFFSGLQWSVGVPISGLFDPIPTFPAYLAMGPIVFAQFQVLILLVNTKK